MNSATHPSSALPLLRARRIVVKVGSALLVDAQEGTPNRGWLAALAEDVAALRARGQEVLLVSSGAIALGRRQLGLTSTRLKLEEKQAAAAVGQIRLAHAWKDALELHRLSVAQILLTFGDTEERRRYLNARNTLSALLRERMRIAPGEPVFLAPDLAQIHLFDSRGLRVTSRLQ